MSAERGDKVRSPKALSCNLLVDYTMPPWQNEDFRSGDGMVSALNFLPYDSASIGGPTSGDIEAAVLRIPCPSRSIGCPGPSPKRPPFTGQQRDAHGRHRTKRINNAPPQRFTLRVGN